MSAFLYNIGIKGGGDGVGGGWWLGEGRIQSTLNYRVTASLIASAWEREEGEVSGKHRRKRNTCQHAQRGRGDGTGQARRGRGRGRGRTLLRVLACVALSSVFARDFPFLPFPGGSNQTGGNSIIHSALNSSLPQPPPSTHPIPTSFDTYVI